MKFTHTLCAAVLLGTLSSTIPSAAFAQEKSKAGQTTTPRTYSLKKNEQVRSASTGGRTGGRADFGDFTVSKAAPKDDKHVFMKYELEDVIVSSIAAKQDGWIEVQNISTGVSKVVKYGGEKWIEILSFSHSKSAHNNNEKWIAIESFSHGFDRSTPDLMLHCANAKDAKGGNQACDKPQAQKQSTKDDMFLKFEGIDGE